MMKRLQCIPGNLTDVNFGINEEVLCQMELGTVIHSGANVNSVLPYTALKRENVGGTLSAIKIALKTGARLRYVSTIDAAVVSNGCETWGAEPTSWSMRMGGYVQSKVVAEHLLYTANRLYPTLDVKGSSGINAEYGGI
eukprot:TRINITY_DN18899_c0_g1_i1.p2 TRINITY_DN18899_c0_g1~~TRINITY_DN18899_c0_g1_i1.p2  ORF type:complete len:139 (-),score=17.91 TRINITY_DN18899_c0_g1_i1:1205-1621(-)